MSIPQMFWIRTIFCREKIGDSELYLKVMLWNKFSDSINSMIKFRRPKLSNSSIGVDLFSILLHSIAKNCFWCKILNMQSRLESLESSFSKSIWNIVYDQTGHDLNFKNFLIRSIQIWQFESNSLIKPLIHQRVGSKRRVLRIPGSKLDTLPGLSPANRTIYIANRLQS